MEVIGGIGRGVGVVVSRVGSGALVEVGSPPPDMEGRWGSRELVVVLPRSLCMLAGGQWEGSFSLGNGGQVMTRLYPCM